MVGFRETLDPVVASESAYLQCPACKGKITPEMKHDLNIRHVWLRDEEKMDRDGKRHSEPRQSRIALLWMEGPAATYQIQTQMIHKLLTAEQGYETIQSGETLKTVVNTDSG